MKLIITVVGKDRIGIIASVCQCLSQNQANVLDISQTILDDYFNMIMIVDYRSSSPLDILQDALKDIGEELGVVIKAQREEIFDAMHRV